MISGCHTTTQSSLPGEGTEEETSVEGIMPLGEQERSPVGGQHLPQTPATATTRRVPGLKPNGPGYRPVSTALFKGVPCYIKHQSGQQGI